VVSAGPSPTPRFYNRRSPDLAASITNKPSPSSSSASRKSRSKKKKDPAIRRKEGVIREGSGISRRALASPGSDCVIDCGASLILSFPPSPVLLFRFALFLSSPHLLVSHAGPEPPPLLSLSLHHGVAAAIK